METVTEKQVMSQEEIQTLSNIQNNTQQLIYELGEIELFTLQMEQRRDDAKKILNDLKSQEQDFNKLIFEKYGKVTINPENGEISKVD